MCGEQWLITGVNCTTVLYASPVLFYTVFLVNKRWRHAAKTGVIGLNGPGTRLSFVIPCPLRSITPVLPRNARTHK